jgi:hypothetical protein
VFTSQKKLTKESKNTRTRVGINFPALNLKLKVMVVFLVLLVLGFAWVHDYSEKHKDDNMSEEGWNEKYNR